MDLSTLTYGAPATEPVPIEPIRVDGMAYAKIIAGMMNVGYFRERPTADGGSERVIVAKLVFPGDPSTVNRAIIVTQAGLDGAMREQVEREQAERRARPKPRITPMRASTSSRGALRGAPEVVNPTPMLQHHANSPDEAIPAFPLRAFRRRPRSHTGFAPAST